MTVRPKTSKYCINKKEKHKGIIVTENTGNFLRLKNVKTILLNNTTKYIFLFHVSERWCVALNFINDFGSPFTLYSSLKHEGYLVSGSGFKLKLHTDRPELHSYVIFNAEDTAKRTLLLNGRLRISEPMVPGCPDFYDVSVTSMQVNVKGSEVVNSEVTNMPNHCRFVISLDFESLFTNIHLSYIK